MNPWNQKSLNLDLILQRNHRMHRSEIFEIKIHEKPKMKSKAIQR